MLALEASGRALLSEARLLVATRIAQLAAHILSATSSGHIGAPEQRLKLQTT